MPIELQLRGLQEDKRIHDDFSLFMRVMRVVVWTAIILLATATCKVLLAVISYLF